MTGVLGESIDSLQGSVGGCMITNQSVQTDRTVLSQPVSTDRQDSSQSVHLCSVGGCVITNQSVQTDRTVLSR